MGHRLDWVAKSPGGLESPAGHAPGHGLLNELPGFMQSRFNPMNLVLNIHLREEAAVEDTWKRIFAFFDTHVRGEQR